MVTFDEFKKLNIITARIENVRDHPNADKLLIDELVGKNIVIINNLEPALIRGIESNGMLLAVQDKNGISLVMPDRNVEPGSKIK